MKNIINYFKEALENAYNIDDQWMKENYDKFNKMYFNNELPKSSEITLKRDILPRKILGQCGFNEKFFYHRSYMKDDKYIMIYKDRKPIDNIFDIGPYIKLSSRVNATLNQWEDTLIHEMVHLWTFKDALSPKQPHGKEFRAKCNEIRKIAKDKYGKDYELTIYADRKDEYELDEKVIRKIKEKNKHHSYRSIYMEFNDGVKNTNWPQQYRFLFCKVENTDKILSPVFKYEGKYLVGLYKSFNTYDKMVDKFGPFSVSRTYRYYDAEDYPGSKEILKVGENLSGNNIEESKNNNEDDVDLIELPSNTDISNLDLEKIENDIEKDTLDNQKGSKENDKKMINGKK